MLDHVDVFFFFKQKTAYELRISDWSSDVCSSDLAQGFADAFGAGLALLAGQKFADLGRPGEQRLADAMQEVGAHLGRGGGPAREGVRGRRNGPETGRAHVRTPVTHAHIVCRTLLDKK